MLINLITWCINRQLMYRQLKPRNQSAEPQETLLIWECSENRILSVTEAMRVGFCPSSGQVKNLAFFFIYIAQTLFLKNLVRLCCWPAFYGSNITWKPAIYSLGVPPAPTWFGKNSSIGVFMIYRERGNHPGQKVYSQQKQHFVFKDSDRRLPND